jgi:hypothetical protein
VTQPDIDPAKHRLFRHVPDRRADIDVDVAVAEHKPFGSPRRQQELTLLVALAVAVHRKGAFEFLKSTAVALAHFRRLVEREERAELAFGGKFDEAGNTDGTIMCHQRPPARAFERSHFVQTIGHVVIIGVNAIGDRRLDRIDLTDDDGDVLREAHAELIPAPVQLVGLEVRHAKADAAFRHSLISLSSCRRGCMTLSDLMGNATSPDVTPKISVRLIASGIDSLRCCYTHWSVPAVSRLGSLSRSSS